MLLRLWLLVLLVCVSAFAPSRADARAAENRTWVFLPTTTETRLETEPQAAGTHQENRVWGYEHAPGCTQAPERTAARQLDLIKQDSLDRWWGVRGDTGQMRPIGSLETGPVRMHGNRLDTPGPHDVYVIRDRSSGRIYHFGETGRGFETRGTEWVRALKEDYGLDTVVEHLRTVDGKAAAKALEPRYIKTYEKAFGIKPGFIDANGNFIQIQKSLH